MRKISVYLPLLMVTIFVWPYREEAVVFAPVVSGGGKRFSNKKQHS